MKNIITLIALFTASLCAFGTTYYVATTGDDSSATPQNINTPWLTIQKGVDTISTGDTLAIVAGSYYDADDLQVNRTLASETFIVTQSGLKDVFISGGNKRTLRQTCSNTTYSNLTFTTYATTDNYATHIIYGSNIKFYNCDWISGTEAGKSPTCVEITCLATKVIDNLLFSGCSFTQTGLGTAIGVACEDALNIRIANVVFTNCVINTGNYAVYHRPLADASTLSTNWTFSGSTITSLASTAFSLNTASDWIITNCTVSAPNGKSITVTSSDNGCTNVSVYNSTFNSPSDAIAIQKCNGFKIANNRLITASSHGLVVGRDGNYSSSTATNVRNGVIYGNIITCTTGHGVIIGADSTNVVFTGNTITGGDHGMVVKENTGIVLSRNTIYGGSVSGVTCKGATNAVICNNTITSSGGGYAYRVYAGDTGNKSSLAVITDNVFVINSGGLACYFDGTGDAGGCIVNGNRFHFKTGVIDYGTIRGNSSLTTTTLLLNAWAGYSVANNDSVSSLWIPDPVKYIKVGGDDGIIIR